MSSERWIPLAVLAALVVAYAGSIGTWRALLRRWRLAGPAAPPRAALSRQEYVARRSLKALLAFDALVMVPLLPFMLLGMVMAALNGELSPFLVLPVLGLALFLVPIPTLLRNVRVLEARRLRGLLEPTDAREVFTGHASLDDVLRRQARATQVTAVLIVAVSLAGWLFPEAQLLLQKDNEAIRHGEAWRLVTVALTHANAVHLAFNVSVFFDVGGVVERLTGSLRMLVVFWVGTAAGTLASMAVFPYPGVGASGGVFALLGALWAVAFRHRRELPPVARARFGRSTAMVIGANLLLGFALPHVDWAAHLGGLAAGAAMGWLFGLGPAARAALAEPR